jgi:hypothetical protein
MFVFDSAAGATDRAASAHGQTEDDRIGAATDDGALDQPSDAGQ